MVEKKYVVGGVYNLITDYRTGSYELIRVAGGKYHLFDNSIGHDIYLTKKELIAAEEKYKSKHP